MKNMNGEGIKLTMFQEFLDLVVTVSTLVILPNTDLNQKMEVNAENQELSVKEFEDED